MSRIDLRPDLVEVVVTGTGVQRQLQKVAAELNNDARTILAGHRRTGQSRITTSRGRVDWYVSLVDKNALYIEFVNRGKGAVSPLRRALTRFFGRRGLDRRGLR